MGSAILLGTIAALLAPGALGAVPQVSRGAASQVSADAGAVTRSETVKRVNLIDGKDQVVDTRNFKVTVGETRDLRDRQEIPVSWSGAHPTGGTASDPNSFAASEQEYPVVLMMCHGTVNGPAAGRITPETCWTQTPGERVEVSQGFAFPPYRLDRYADPSDRDLNVGLPNPYPKACQAAPSAQHWVPFVGADGHVYQGASSNESGTLICDAGIPPEQAAGSASLQPGNTTYGASNLQGKGSANFVITTNETNASLGCSQSVPCSLVVIPIMGISCDAAGLSVAPADRPSSLGEEQAAQDLCTQTGAFGPGSQNTNPGSAGEDLSVAGQLWWSASNWRNRITIPLSFAPPSNVCSLHSTGTPTNIYGSYYMLQATQQWGPYFCLNKKLFPLQHVQTGEVEAKNLLQAGSIQAAFEALPPTSAFSTPTVQAPTAVTGFAVVYAIDTAKGVAYLHLRLDARLLAKLLTESYPSHPTVQAEDKSLWNPTTHKPNPLDLADDPEFQALNPGLPTTLLSSQELSASTILVNSADTDVMTALTTYINDDPEARSWLNGKPDPWGMVVNPAYKGIKLPVSSFPLLDTFEPPGIYTPTVNPCLADDPVPWLPQVASPVQQPSAITLDLQFDQSTSQVQCSGDTVQNQKLVAVGREAEGQRFLLGVTSLSDADRYGLRSAALETQGGSTSSAQFTTASGRTFVTPTAATLRNAAALLTPNKKADTWLLPYSAMRTEKAGADAYPGTLLMSTDVPTTGLPATTAHNLSTFLDFVAGAGQAQGLGNGQLPPGFLPLTAANGLGKLVAYTKSASTAVDDQKGVVPSLAGGGTTSPSPSQSPTPTSSSSQSGSGVGQTSPSSPLPTASTPSTPGSSPAVAPSPTAVKSSAPVLSTASLGNTAAIRSTVSGLVFPVVLLAALLCGAGALAFWRLDRPKSSP